MSASIALASGSVNADDLLQIGGQSVYVGPQTVIRVDTQTLPAGSAVPNKPGMRVEATYAPSGAARAGGGPAAAATVVFSYVVRGPVTSLSPLRVLGQELSVTADTKSTGLPGGSFASIRVGDDLDVSGYVDTNNSLMASFVEFLPVATPRWLLSGYVSSVGPGPMVSLGPQQVDVAGVTPSACGAAIVAGQFVEIRATSVSGFTASTPLRADLLRCLDPMPIGTPGALGALSGIVGEALSPMSFQFGPYVVTYDANTAFRFGSAGDLLAGAAIEVDGTFGNYLAFAAAGIQFAAPTIRLEGPALPGDVVTGTAGAITLMGNTVLRSAQLRDRDDLYSNGIAQSRQIEVRGYMDHLGNLFATRARTRGAPDLSSVRIGGPVAAVDRPLLSVLGNTLDSTGATFEDPAALSITANDFFSQVSTGASVEQTGSYDAGSKTLTGGVMALIAVPDPPPPATLPAFIVGTLLATDRIFFSAFE